MAKNPGIRLEEWVRLSLLPYYPDAKRTKASGALHNEGDVCAGPFVIEAKDRPSQKSISITGSVWRKVKAAASRVGKMALVVNHTADGYFVTMGWNAFHNLLFEARQNTQTQETKGE